MLYRPKKGLAKPKLEGVKLPHLVSAVEGWRFATSCGIY
jgi:hypothetical protein